MINQTDKLDLKREEVDVIILSPLIIFFNLNLCHYETVTLKGPFESLLDGVMTSTRPLPDQDPYLTR